MNSYQEKLESGSSLTSLEIFVLLVVILRKKNCLIAGHLLPEGSLSFYARTNEEHPFLSRQLNISISEFKLCFDETYKFRRIRETSQAYEIRFLFNEDKKDYNRQEIIKKILNQENIKQADIDAEEIMQIKVLRSEQERNDKEKKLIEEWDFEQQKLREERSIKQLKEWQEKWQKRREEEALKQETIKREMMARDIEEKRLSKSLLDFLQHNFLYVDEFYQNKCIGIMDFNNYQLIKQNFVKEWAINNFPFQPDLEQLKAIGSVNNHIQVVARAGSGKTSTIVNRALFLQKHCGIAPHEMLLLAFNRKAAEEIKTRLTEKLGDELPHIMTFHALAYALVHPEEELLVDQSDGTQAKSRALQSIIDDHLRDEYFYDKIKSLMLDRFYADWQEIVRLGYGKSPEEMVEIRRSMSEEGLDGKSYKSFGEKTIANFLFEHDIPYKYERNYKWNGRSYHPDFTIFKSSKTGIIIEYFGLRGDPDYDEMSEQKKVFWENNPSWSFLELFPEDVRADMVAKKIKQKVEELNIPYRKLSDEEIWEKIKDRVIDKFTKAIGQFVQRCRKLSLTPEEVEQKIKDYNRQFFQESNTFKQSLYDKYIPQINQFEDGFTHETSHKICSLISECYQYSINDNCKVIDNLKNAFLKEYNSCKPANPKLYQIINQLCQDLKSLSIVKRFHELGKIFYSAYLERLSATGEEDFDGLMQRSADLVKGGQTIFRRRAGDGNLENLKYIFIDEYQDFSELFYNLIDAIRQQNPNALFFCVGDDWQAINGFAGSDLRFFTNFPDYFSEAQKLYLSTNYRSCKSIVQVSNSLMSGLGKPGIAHKSETGNVQYVDLDSLDLNEWEKEHHPGDKITPAVLRIIGQKLKSNQKVVLLSRKSYIHWYTNETDNLDKFIKYIYDYFKLSDEKKHDVTISTSHKYKGLEKTVVIILDAVERCYPLVHPDWIFMEIFGDTVQKLVQDERRLFYVALSRAVDELLIVTDTNNDKPSRFIEDLLPIPTTNWEQYSYVPPVVNSSQFLIKVFNQVNIVDAGTYQIRNVLRSNGYKWNPRKRTWSKIIPSSDFNLYEPFKNSIWASEADGIEVTISDPYYEKPIAVFHINDGNYIRLNFEQRIVTIDEELQRLEWSEDQGKQYLQEHYGKRSRHQLSDQQLDEFLDYLKNL